MKKVTILFTLLITTLFSCSYNSEDDLIEDIIIIDLVNYEDNIKSIIDNNCINCHSNPPINGAPMSLTSYIDVNNAIENRDLIERISSNDLSFVMPFGGPRLPQNIIDLVIQWETDGLLEN